MSNGIFERSLLVTGIGLALGLTGGSEAAVVRGSFDPVDFSGQFDLQFNTACLAADGWYSATACNVTLLSSSATIDSTSPDPVFYGTLGFGPASPPTVLGMFVSGGKLDSFDTLLIHQNPPGSPSIDWWIQFSSGHDPYGNYGPACLSCESFTSFTGPLLGRFVYLYDGTQPQSPPAAMASYLNETFVRLDTVPEPGMLWLLSGAVVAALLTRRRPSPDRPS